MQAQNAPLTINALNE